jgi:cell division protease FtsH
MSEERNTKNAGRPERRPTETRVPPRAWLLWLAILSLIPLLVFFKDRTESRSRILTHTEFVELFENKQIEEGTIHYNPQSPLREITGRLTPVEGSGSSPLPFRLETRVNDALEERLLLSGRFKVAEPSTMLTNLMFTLLPFLLLAGLIYFFLIRQIKMAGKGALSFGKSRARMLNKEKNRTTFKDVAGVEEAKDEVVELVEFLKDPKKFQRLGGRIPKGILMVGPPGTGKTLLAKAIAGEADAAFYSISGSDFVEMFVGVGASRVRDMFEQARKNTPCLVFIDEIDAVGRSRGHGLGGGNDEREQTLNALLVEMDGFDTQDGIIIIAATNRPDVLDPALLRPGRFDRQITVNLPDVRGREAILKVHSRNVKLAPGVDLGVIARGTPGFSGAELANLLNEAALLAARMNKKGITMSELEEARDKVRWGRERRSLAMTEDEKRATAWHEAGHAVVNVLLEHTHPLHKVTIIPRGQALGSTMWLPEKDLLSRKRKELNDLIAVTMAGRIAEELFTQDISSGAAGDIQQATTMAKAMVMHWGMSDKLGMVQYGDNQEFVFLGRDMLRSKDYSEQTAEEIDFEVKRIITENFDRARQLLLDHRDRLELVARALLEFETLDGAQVTEIIKTGKLTPPPPPPETGPPTGAQAATPLPEVPKPLPPKLPPGLASPAPVVP